MLIFGNRTRTSTAKWPAISAVVLALTACGGGGDGAFVANTPPPPPTPTPTPTPGAFSISAPDRATGPGAMPVFATPDGPSFTSGPAAGTVFPLLQTAMIYDANSARPDAVTNAAGSTATFQAGALDINADAFIQTDVRSSSSNSANLDWTRVGYWSTGGGWWDYDDVVGRQAVFVTGYETPVASVPTTGTATFTGSAQGSVFLPGNSPGSTHCACAIVQVDGTASFSADFGARTLAGSLTNMVVGDRWSGDGYDWNDVAFTSTIAGNAFSGTTSVTSAPPGALGANATGTLEGRFFGPSAQEAGAVWTLFDGTNAAIGTLGGKRP